MPTTRTDATNHPDHARRGHHALRARARKRQEAHDLGIDAGFISTMVDRFYVKVRNDPVLGPFFADRITDWPLHLDRMKSFWRAVLHNSGEYSGSPMRSHLAIAGLKRTHFARWLDLFRETLTEIERDPTATERVHGRARMIANSLLNGIATARDCPKDLRIREEL